MCIRGVTIRRRLDWMIAFIDHINIKLVTIVNYNTTADFHTTNH
jgi:hypothetical protein